MRFWLLIVIVSLFSLGCSSIAIVTTSYSEKYKTDFESLLQESLPDGYTVDVVDGPEKKVDLTGYGFTLSDRKNWGAWQLDLSWTYLVYKNLDMTLDISDGSTSEQSEFSFLVSSSGLELLGGYALGNNILRFGLRRTVFTMMDAVAISSFGSINIAQNQGVLGYEYVVPTNKGAGFYLRGDYGLALDKTKDLESSSMTTFSLGYFW